MLRFFKTQLELWCFDLLFEHERDADFCTFLKELLKYTFQYFFIVVLFLSITRKINKRHEIVRRLE